MSGTVLEEVRDQIDGEVITILMFVSDEVEVLTEVPDGMDLMDLDSFSVVQLILSLEDSYSVDLLDDMSSFEGQSLDDLALFVAVRVEAKRAEQLEGRPS